MYNRTADNDARVERGHFENEGIDAKITRMQYVERAVHSAQLARRASVRRAQASTGRPREAACVAMSRIASEFVQVDHAGVNGGEQLQWLNTGNEGAVRTFSTLNENSNEGKADYQLSFTAFGREHTIKIGGLGRQTTRDADTRAYSISAPGAGARRRRRSTPNRSSTVGSRSRPTACSSLAPLSQGGSYDARDHSPPGT